MYSSECNLQDSSVAIESVQEKLGSSLEWRAAVIKRD